MPTRTAATLGFRVNRTPAFSLFVRNREREPFAYLGELNYLDHKQFQRRGRTQQRCLFDLKERVPDSLLAELSEGVIVRTKPKQQSPAAAIGRRRPASLDEFKKAFYYALGNAERLVSPKHHNYQVRLRRYLELKKVPAEFEKDFIDVR